MVVESLSSRELVDVVAEHHVLEPRRAVLLDGVGDLLGGRDVPVAVALEHDVDPVADGLADALERLEALAELGRGDVAAGAAERDPVERPDLHRPDAFVEQLLGEGLGLVELCPEVLERPLAVTAAVLVAAVHRAAAGVVGGDAVVGEAAEQLPDRRAERLAEDVPERGIDRGDRPHLDAGATPARRALRVEAVPVPLDLAGVLAQEHRGCPVVDGAADRGGGVVGVARPDQALVGVDADEDEERDLADLDGLERGDLHRPPSACAAGRWPQPRRVASAIISTARMPAGIGVASATNPWIMPAKRLHVDGHAGGAELEAVDLALVAERVEGRGDDERGRESAEALGVKDARGGVRVAAGGRRRGRGSCPRTR